jgi:hypothetical protein
MANLFDRLKRDRNAGAQATEPSGADVQEPAAAVEDDVRGKDPRRLAEEKADRAGEKWRREAEARGEVEKEVGGPKGLEPTRYGDWDKAGRCIDF